MAKMQYEIVPASGEFTLFSTVDGQTTTRIGVRPKLAPVQRLAEQTSGRRLTWVKRADGVYVSA
jgi:hypothetical protein